MKNQEKADKYESVLLQIKGVTDGEPNLVANLANISAIIYDAFKFWWVGFYVVENNELVLAPFQGPVACTRIQKGRGVCGTAWKENKTQLVEDVHAFPGHIACSAASQSEVVVPISKNGEVKMVLDVDSEHLNHFDATDANYMEQIGAFISENLL